MATADYLTPDHLHRALSLRDLTDPTQGEHAIQTLLTTVVHALRSTWQNTVRYVRTPPIVAVSENYDRLGYHPDDVTRARRHTRYVSPTAMLRSHTSAQIPTALEDYVGRSGVDELIVVPGLVYRRDVVDRSHVGEPHQVDLWRIRDVPETSDEDMLVMISRIVEAVLPGADWKITDASHPYTVGGRQIDVLMDGEWLELAECGSIPAASRERLAIRPGQSNLLVRIILRPIDRTLTAQEANAIRNTIYSAVHHGPVMELI